MPSNSSLRTSKKNIEDKDTKNLLRFNSNSMETLLDKTSTDAPLSPNPTTVRIRDQYESKDESHQEDIENSKYISNR